MISGCCHIEMVVASMRDGVDLEGRLLMGDVVELRLFGVDHAPAIINGIERARASRIVETDTIGTRRDLVLGYDPNHGHDTLEGQCQLDIGILNHQTISVEEGIGKASGVGKADFSGIGRSGVAIAAMGENHEEIVALGQLERHLSEMLVADLLHFLTDALASIVVDQIIDARTDFLGSGPGAGGEGCLFVTADVEHHVGRFVAFADSHFLTL